jgi:uridine monophosphate synthetase
LIYPRKEVKAHGTGQAIEGAFEAGHTALVIEDVVTTGSSILTAIKTLEEAGLIVRDIAVLVDREQGGQAVLMDKGYHLHAVLTISQMLDALQDQERISAEMVQAVQAYLRNA